MVLFGLLVAHKKVNKYKTPSRPPDTSACTAIDAAIVTLTPFVLIIENDVGFIAGLLTISVIMASPPRTTDMLVDMMLVKVSPTAKSGETSIVITRVSSGFL